MNAYLMLLSRGAMVKINKYCTGVGVSAIVGLYSCGELFIIIVQQENSVFARQV